VLEPLPAHDEQLVLRERRVDVGQGDGVERQVPGGEPRVLPRVRHREDVPGVHVGPGRVPARPSLRRGWRLRRVTVQPALDVVAVELLAPDHPRERLTGDEPLVLARGGRDHLAVELVRLGAARREDLVEPGAERGRRRRRPQPHAHHLRLPRLDLQAVPGGGLGPRAVGVDRRRPGDHSVVDAVLRERGRVRRPEHAARVGLVLAEQQVRRRSVRRDVHVPLQVAEEGVAQGHPVGTGGLEHRALHARLPRPGVAEPQLGQHVHRRTFGSGVRDPDLHQQVVRVGLGVHHVDHPVPVVVEHARIQEFVLALAVVAPTVLGHEVAVGELVLRVVVAPLQPRVAGEGVEVPPVLLGVLTVVAFGPGEAEHPLLQDRVAPVPQGQGHAQVLPDVADAGHAVLTPAIGARTGVIVREVLPRRAVRAVVLPDRAPRPFGQVRAPVIPGCRLGQPVLGVPEGIHSLTFCAAHRALLFWLGPAKDLCGCLWRVGWGEGVVPLAVEGVGGQGEGVDLVFGVPDAGGVVVGV